MKDGWCLCIWSFFVCIFFFYPPLYIVPKRKASRPKDCSNSITNEHCWWREGWWWTHFNQVFFLKVKKALRLFVQINQKCQYHHIHHHHHHHHYHYHTLSSGNSTASHSTETTQSQVTIYLVLTFVWKLTLVNLYAPLLGSLGKQIAWPIFTKFSTDLSFYLGHHFNIKTQP